MVPRAQHAPGDLAVYRRLANVLKGVVEEFTPRCVFLDIERLLVAERSAAGS